jgi:L-alanine-DL-glutamate epimerase-like enolase superfamily enzyme
VGIKAVEVYLVTLRYREPFRIAPSTSIETKNVVVKVQTDYDVIGIGEASPSKRVTHETQETVLQTLDAICPSLIGMCPLRIEQIIETMDNAVPEQPSAKAAIDMALHDVLGKTAKRPLFKLLGGFRTSVLTDITLSIKEPQEMGHDAAKAVAEGFRALKVKVGIDPEDDCERIRRIRESAGSDIAVRIDANQGWTLGEAMNTLSKLEAFDIELVEQPIAADDIHGLATLRKSSPIPIMADESVHTPSDALRLIREDAVDLINIKLMKCGGIWNGRKIAALAEAAGVRCMIGCMGESAIGITAGVHLAAALKNIQYADLDSDILLKDRLVQQGGAELKASERIPSEHAGLGIRKLDARLLGQPVRVYQ